MKDQLVGTWTVVSAEIVRPNGTRSAIFGPNPRGVMILDTGGRFSQQIVSSERPRSLTADELAYRTAATIGAAVEARWKRAR